MSEVFDLFENTSDAVFGIDKNGCVKFWNNACDILFGFSNKHAVGRHCSTLLCGTDLLDNKFCGSQCPIPKQNNDQANVRDFDLIVRQSNGESLMVNISSIYTPVESQGTVDNISVFFSLRRINCHRLIQRLASSSCSSENANKQKNLSQRESSILRHASLGLSTNQIAEHFNISKATVRNHFKNIYKKLGVHSRAEAIGYSMNHGLI